jgi:hypothetical protein
MEATAKDRAARSSVLDAERQFFAWLSMAILAIAILGFLRNYILVPFIGLPDGLLAATAWVHVHAAIFFSWCLLLAIQSWLVVAGRVSPHRTLGTVGFVLFIGMVFTGPIVAVRSVVRLGTPAEELAFLAVSLGNVIAYAAILGAAFHWRRSPAIHKRLIMLGMVALLTAPFGRLVDMPYQLAHVVGPGLVVVAMGIWDCIARRELHPVTKYAGPAVLLWELAPNLYMDSSWWLSFAGWLTRVAV